MMEEKSSLPCSDGVAWNNVTTSWIQDNHDLTSSNIFYVRDLALKVIYIIIGIVGVLDNAFVIIIFIFLYGSLTRYFITFDWRYYNI